MIDRGIKHRVRCYVACGGVILAAGFILTVLYPLYIENRDMIRQTANSIWWRFNHFFTRNYSLETDLQTRRAFWSWAFSLCGGATVAFVVNHLLFARSAPKIIRSVPYWCRLATSIVVVCLLLPFCRVGFAISITGKRSLIAPVAVGLSLGFSATMFVLGISSVIQWIRTKGKGKFNVP
jgi:hypothetical protein